MVWPIFFGLAISRCLSTTPHPIWRQGGSILLVHYSMIVLKAAIKFVLTYLMQVSDIRWWSLKIELKSWMFIRSWPFDDFRSLEIMIPLLFGCLCQKDFRRRRQQRRQRQMRASANTTKNTSKNKSKWKQVWPDLAKFRHLGMILKIFGRFERVNLVKFWTYFRKFLANSLCC